MMQDQQEALLHELLDPSLPRLAPGDDQSTTKALATLLAAGSKLVKGSGRLRVLDIGCGNGASTLGLARQLDGTNTAVDNHQPYLDELVRRAAEHGVKGKVRPLLRDMADMGLPEGAFELIWSEGALYNMGFRTGIELCHSLLVPGGMLAASELCWLRPAAPVDCRQFFASEYPAMASVEANLAIIEDSGFRIVGHFVLPESTWTESYYRPLNQRLASFRKKYASNRWALDLLDSVRREIDIFDRYAPFYGYVFFQMIRDAV